MPVLSRVRIKRRREFPSCCLIRGLARESSTRHHMSNNNEEVTFPTNPDHSIVLSRLGTKYCDNHCIEFFDSSTCLNAYTNANVNARSSYISNTNTNISRSRRMRVCQLFVWRTQHNQSQLLAVWNLRSPAKSRDCWNMQFRFQRRTACRI